MWAAPDWTKRIKWAEHLSCPPPPYFPSHPVPLSCSASWLWMQDDLLLQVRQPPNRAKTNPPPWSRCCRVFFTTTGKVTAAFRWDTSLCVPGCSLTQIRNISRHSPQKTENRICLKGRFCLQFQIIDTRWQYGSCCGFRKVSRFLTACEVNIQNISQWFLFFFILSFSECFF